MSHTNNSRERGFILVTVTFLVLLMGGLASTLLIEIHGAKKSVDHQETSLQALQLVELGIARAELEVFALKDSGSDGIGTVSGNIVGEPYAVSGAAHASVTDRWTLTAAASHGLSRRRVEVGIRRRAGGAFMEGIYSKGKLTLDGASVTDSYDSRLGTYASQAVRTDAFGSYARTRGHVGSGEDIVANGGSIGVRGNAIPGQDSEVLESGSPYILGDTYPRTQDVELADTPLSAFVAAHDNNNNTAIALGYNASRMSLRLTGAKHITLTAGTYFFSNVALSGTSTISVSGDVKIYVTGEFNIGGGGVLNTGNPSALQVFSHPYPLPLSSPPTRSEVRVHGGARFSAAVYAPEVDVFMAGGIEYFGAFVGGQITSGGSFEFHYDEALGDMIGSGIILLERLYWRDIAPPGR